MRNSDEAGEISFVEALGAKLAIFVEGEPQEDPVFLLHGGPGVPDYLADVAEISLGGIKGSETNSVGREDRPLTMGASA
jgi:hypothetical protein